MVIRATNKCFSCHSEPLHQATLHLQEHEERVGERKWQGEHEKGSKTGQERTACGFWKAGRTLSRAIRPHSASCIWDPGDRPDHTTGRLEGALHIPALVPREHLHLCLEGTFHQYHTLPRKPSLGSQLP